MTWIERNYHRRLRQDSLVRLTPSSARPRAGVRREMATSRAVQDDGSAHNPKNFKNLWGRPAIQRLEVAM